MHRCQIDTILCPLFSSFCYVVPFQESFSLLPVIPIQPPLISPPLLPPSPLPVQFPPVLATASRITPQEPYLAPQTGLTLSRRNILRDRVLASPDVFLHRQKTRRLPYRLLQGVFTCPVRCSMRELSRQPSRHLGLKPPHDLAHVGSEHPGPPSEDQYCLFLSFKKEAEHLRRRSLLAEDVQHPLLQCLRPVQVPHHIRSVVVSRQDHPP